ICFMAAASSEAGPPCSPAATAVRLPSWYCLRQRNNWRKQYQEGSLTGIAYASYFSGVSNTRKEVLLVLLTPEK
ncbi:hypothetical protein PSZ55_23595, partial [Shigella sonnei]|nr:hypothetical protein [Shigella sonnei]